jgi:hypothetical protein
MARKKPGPAPKPRPRGRQRGIRIQGEYGCKTCQHPECARINFLVASGGDKTAIATQFGVSRRSLVLHYASHVTARFKRIIGASRMESFEALLTKAAEGETETLDILNLLVRGHSQAWALALETGSNQAMVQHAGKILQASELRSKITRELVPGPTFQVNYLLHDAAQIVEVLHQHPEAADELLRWYQRRTDTKVIEHAPGD